MKMSRILTKIHVYAYAHCVCCIVYNRLFSYDKQYWYFQVWLKSVSRTKCFFQTHQTTIFYFYFSSLPVCCTQIMYLKITRKKYLLCRACRPTPIFRQSLVSFGQLCRITVSFFHTQKLLKDHIWNTKKLKEDVKKKSK